MRAWSLAILRQNLRCHLFAGPTASADTEFGLQAQQIRRARRGGVPDLFLSYCIADTYVHALIEAQMRMIVNSITVNRDLYP